MLGNHKSLNSTYNINHNAFTEFSEDEESDVEITGKMKGLALSSSATNPSINRNDAIDSGQVAKSSSSDDFPFPEYWNDEKRVQVLSAPFRARVINPQNYDSKMNFWQDIIEKYCLHKSSAIFSKSQIQLKFTKGNNVPYCLDEVLDQLLKSKKIRLRHEYEYDPLNSWTGWALNGLLWRPLSWSSSKIKGLGSRLVGVGQNPDVAKGFIDFVHLEVMKRLCNELYDKVLIPRQGEIIELETLLDLVREAFKKSMPKDCLILCLQTLHCQQKLGLGYRTEARNKNTLLHLIKVPAKGEQMVKISETDYSIFSLKETRNTLTKLIEKLELNIRDQQEKAEQKMREKSRQMAKVHLRKKHLLEKNLQKRTVALHNIEILLESLEETKTNGEIVDAYKYGSRALKQVLDDNGLTADNVDDVVSELRETLDIQKEIDDTLSASVVSETGFSEGENAEIESELNEILISEKSKTKVPTPSQQKKEASSNNNNSTKSSLDVDISERELLEMLDQLEVENSSVNDVVSLNLAKNNNNNSVCSKKSESL